MENKPRLLIVDDDILTIDFLVDTLKDDYSLFIAKEGATALDLAMRHEPDVILLDIIMPGVDGFQLLSHLRTTSELPDTAVVFMSGLVSEEHQKLATELGPDAYLKKPLSADKVLFCVQAQLEKLAKRG